MPTVPWCGRHPPVRPIEPPRRAQTCSRSRADRLARHRLPTNAADRSNGAPESRRRANITASCVLSTKPGAHCKQPRKREIDDRNLHEMRDKLAVFKGSPNTSPYCTWVNDPREPEELPEDWVPDEPAMAPLPTIRPSEAKAALVLRGMGRRSKFFRRSIPLAAVGAAVAALTGCDSNSPTGSGANPRQVTVVGSGQVQGSRTP